MDTSGPAIIDVVPARPKITRTSRPKRERRSLELKRKIVEETLVPGASVARVARAHGINANQVFGWRRQYLAGRLGAQRSIKLLPVTLQASGQVAPAGEPGAIHIKLQHAQIRIEGSADVALLRAVLELLRS
jgi:transposase